MQVRLPPQIEALWRREALLGRVEIGCRLRALTVRIVAGTRAPLLIDDIDRVSLAQEISCRAHAPIGGAGEVCASLDGAMHRYDRIAVRLVLRDLEFRKICPAITRLPLTVSYLPRANR